MEKTLAARLHDFYKEYNYYEYCDNFVGPTEEDEIAALDLRLQDADSANGILNRLMQIQEDLDLDAEQKTTLDGLINDVGRQAAEMGTMSGESIEPGML